MKIINKLITTTFIALWVLVLGGTNVFAIPAPHYLGDANLDFTRNIKDATIVQKYVARIENFTYLQELVADTDSDGSITIKDATLIQKDVADLVRIDGEIYTHITNRGSYANYNSGKAMAGVPVTFTANTYCLDDRAYPLTYEFCVDDELIQKNNTGIFGYTFPTADKYNVIIKVTNNFGKTKNIEFPSYKVVAPYESETPVIKALYPDHSSYHPPSFDESDENVTFTAEAIFGAGDYKYEFLLDGKVIREYSDSNTYTFEKMPPTSPDEYTLTVRVKDSSTGDNYVSLDYVFTSRT